MSCITEQNILLQMKQQELEEANQRLEGLATTDGLTGLKNHRTFQEELEKQFQSASKSGTPLSLILFDVDKFKMFNDEFGHQAGDEVLVKVALTLRQVARKGEYLARYGGEEFAIVLPNQDAESACETAERFRVALETGDWRHRQVTASFGVSTYRVGMTDRANLVSEADQSLYVSKDAGRNRVSHFDQVETDDVAA